MIVYTTNGLIFTLRHLPKTKERKKLLELACGTGIQSVRFSQAGFDVTGLDLSADMLKIAEKRAASAKQKIAFIEGNMLDLSKAGNMTLLLVIRTQSAICRMRWKWEMSLRKCIMLLTKMVYLSLTCIRPTRQTRFFPGLFLP